MTSALEAGETYGKTSPQEQDSGSAIVGGHASRCKWGMDLGPRRHSTPVPRSLCGGGGGRRITLLVISVPKLIGHVPG